MKEKLLYIYWLLVATTLSSCYEKIRWLKP
jgi:hypothetical protein